MKTIYIKIISSLFFVDKQNKQRLYFTAYIVPNYPQILFITS